MPSDATQLAINFYSDTSGTAGANDWIEFEQVMINTGPTAAEFRMAGGTIGEEIALCQRYYEFGTFRLQMDAGTNATYRFGSVADFKVQKRVTPTMTLTNNGGLALQAGLEAEIGTITDKNVQINAVATASATSQTHGTGLRDS
jgi:hypothetical protein